MPKRKTPANADAEKAKERLFTRKDRAIFNEAVHELAVKAMGMSKLGAKKIAQHILDNLDDKIKKSAKCKPNERDQKVTRAINFQLAKHSTGVFYQISPFKVDWNYEYFLNVKLNPSGYLKWWEDRKKKKPVKNGPIETLIEDIADELNQFGNVSVRNGYLIYGSSERDLAFLCYTKDGMQSIGKYVTSSLMLREDELVASVTTQEIGWNLGYEAHSGDVPDRSSKKRSRASQAPNT